jgi:two-component system alkaline phosphatase synthesis response regulator PhoP
MSKFALKKILVIDANLQDCAKMEENLQRLGFVSCCVNNLENFEEKIYSYKPDFIILEKSLELAGPSVILKVRSTERFRALPILIITQGDDFLAKKNVLMLGADSFLQKPVCYEELNLKIQVLLRRSMSYHCAVEDILYKNLKLSPLSGEVFIDSSQVHFTPTEFKVLETLVVEKGRPVRRDFLARSGSNSIKPNLRTIDVHINSIRTKLGQIGRNIKTLRGRGYMLID